MYPNDPMVKRTNNMTKAAYTLDLRNCDFAIKIILITPYSIKDQKQKFFWYRSYPLVAIKRPK
jgi:hypothetical protein